MGSVVRHVGLACIVLLASAPPDAAAEVRWTAPRDAVERVAGRAVAPGGPLLAGVPLRVALSPATAGQWREAPAGGQSWSLELHSPGALWLGLGLEGVRLEPGARLELRDADGRPVAVRPRADGQLWTPPIDGDLVRLELSWPEALRGRQPEIVLTTVTHGYRPWTTGDSRVLAGQSDCNVDVNCSPQGDAWRDERRGVVQMVVMNTGAVCTGSLINNTANLATTADPFDQTYPLGLRCAPYVLTADHCYDAPPGGPAGTAASTTFLFNYEVDPTGSCSGGLAPGDAPRSQIQTGATKIANYDPSDFHLLLLDDLPPREFGVYLNGWNRSAAAPAEVTTIHHPADQGADVAEVRPKKISHSPDPPANGIAFGSNHWRIVAWDEGAPEPGSSGAPLFDQNQLVVGQLHGGESFGQGCQLPGSDEFGKLSASWTGGGTSATRLSTHLDPLNTAATMLPGLDLQTCLTQQPGVVRVAHVVHDGTLIGNGDGVADPGDVLLLEVELANGRAVPATGVSATLAPTVSPNVLMLDGDAGWGTIAPLAGRASQSPHFSLQLSEALTCGSAPEMQLSVTTAQGSTTSLFRLATGTPAQTFYDDGDSGTAGFTCAPGLCVGGDTWSAPAPWTHACTPSGCPDRSWQVPDATLNTNASLIAPAIRRGNLAAGSKLSFRHFLRSETGLDGAVLEYSTDGGANWIDAYGLITDGFYDATIDAASTSLIKGRAAWSGVFEGWREVQVDLGSFALGAGNLDLRWRFVSDSGGSVAGGGGWWVDDVRIVGGAFTCNGPPSFHYPGARCLRGDSGDRFPCGERQPPRSAGPSRVR